MNKYFILGITSIALVSFVAGIFFCMVIVIRQHIFIP